MLQLVGQQSFHKLLINTSKVSLGIAIFIRRWFSHFYQQCMLFNADIVLFSLICLFTIGRVVDMIQVGLVRSKNVMIISPKYVAIQERLLRELDKGVTLGANRRRLSKREKACS